MVCISRRLVGLLSASGLGMVLLACSGQGGDAGGVGQSVDPLLGGGDGGAANSCVSCIESSCGSQLAALEAELKTIHTATEAAFTCVQNNGCLSLFWSDVHDAGPAGAEQAVSACIAACDAAAGVPDRDAAESDLMSLTDALKTCVDTSCATVCPGADHDAGGAHLTGPTHDSGTVSAVDAGVGNGTGNGSGNGSGSGSGSGGNGFGNTADCGTDFDSGDGHHHGF
jgi:hypothetical protein